MAKVTRKAEFCKFYVINVNCNADCLTKTERGACVGNLGYCAISTASQGMYNAKTTDGAVKVKHMLFYNLAHSHSHSHTHAHTHSQSHTDSKSNCVFK